MNYKDSCISILMPLAQNYQKQEKKKNNLVHNKYFYTFAVRKLERNKSYEKNISTIE